MNGQAQSRVCEILNSSYMWCSTACESVPNRTALYTSDATVNVLRIVQD